MLPWNQKQVRATVLSLLAVGVLVLSLRNSTTLSSTSAEGSLSAHSSSFQVDDEVIARRRLIKVDPKTTVTKVPKVVHFVLAGTPLGFMMKVIEYSTKVIKSHGFEVMVHRDDDCEELIRENYPKVLPAWELLKDNPKFDKGTRMADFLRVVVLYHYGGIYLDGDMLSCQDLSELREVPGMASFPVVLSKSHQLVNAVMSGPPKHLMWQIALDIMIEKGEGIVNEHILAATGPSMMATAFDTYCDVLDLTPPIRFDDPQIMPEPEDENAHWFTVGDVRLGALKRGARRSSRGLGNPKALGLQHFHWGSWGDNNKANTECNRNYDLIDPFLDYQCKYMPSPVHWRECGTQQDMERF